MPSYYPAPAGALDVPKIGDTESGLVPDGGYGCYSFFYFINQVEHLVVSKCLEEVCVSRFHDLFINRFLKLFLKGWGILSDLIPFDNTKMGYYLVLCNT